MEEDMLKKVGEVGKPVIEFLTTEKFPKLVKNVVFMTMTGIMVYMMLRAFMIITPAAEYVAGQFSSFFGTMIVLSVPIMFFFLLFALIKAILKVVS